MFEFTAVQFTTPTLDPFLDQTLKNPSSPSLHHVETRGSTGPRHRRPNLRHLELKDPKDQSIEQQIVEVVPEHGSL